MSYRQDIRFAAGADVQINMNPLPGSLVEDVSSWTFELTLSKFADSGIIVQKRGTAGQNGFGLNDGPHGEFFGTVLAADTSGIVVQSVSGDPYYWQCRRVDTDGNDLLVWGIWTALPNLPLM